MNVLARLLVVLPVCVALALGCGGKDKKPRKAVHAPAPDEPPKIDVVDDSVKAGISPGISVRSIKFHEINGLLVHSHILYVFSPQQADTAVTKVLIDDKDVLEKTSEALGSAIVVEMGILSSERLDKIVLDDDESDNKKDLEALRKVALGKPYFYVRNTTRDFTSLKHPANVKFTLKHTPSGAETTILHQIIAFDIPAPPFPE